MPLSSACAVPLSIDLEVSRLERSLLAVIAVVALLGLWNTQFAPAWQAAGAIVVLGLAARALVVLYARPAKLTLHADGAADVEGQADVPRWIRPLLRRQPPQATASSPLPIPTSLTQATWFGPVPLLEFRILDGARHALALFPDRLDATSRQRLRVWLATHRPLPAEGRDTGMQA